MFVFVSRSVTCHTPEPIALFRRGWKSISVSEPRMVSVVQGSPFFWLDVSLHARGFGQTLTRWKQWTALGEC